MWTKATGEKVSNELLKCGRNGYVKNLATELLKC